MVTDQQMRRLMVLRNKEKTLSTAASKAGMDENSARKYLRLGKLPSQVREPHTWLTREDPFEDVWAYPCPIGLYWVRIVAIAYIPPKTLHTQLHSITGLIQS